jgi:nitrite reductase (NADH) large subunit
MGIVLRESARTRGITGTDHVGGVELDTGEIIPAELVILATGVRPDTHLARRAGLAVNKGVIVDNHLRTSHPDILAAGDVAEHNGVLYGTWGPSQYQGAIAGMNAVGGDALFGGLPRANALKVLGIDLVSIGQFEPEDGSFIVVDREYPGQFLHFVFHDGKMVGCILLGEASAGAGARHAIENKTDFSALLAARPTVDDVLRQLGR